MRLRLLAVILSVCALSGCATQGEGGSAVGHYFSARGKDFLDIFEVGFEAGEGARLDVRYGIGMFGGGLGYVHAVRVGQRSFLRTAGLFEAAPLPAPVGVLIALGMVAVGKDRIEDFLVLAILAGVAKDVEMGQDGYIACIPACFPPNDDGVQVNWPKAFPIGAEIVLGAGVRARVYPMELFDFVAGLLTIDFAHDDSVRYQFRAPPETR